MTKTLSACALIPVIFLTPLLHRRKPATRRTAPLSARSTSSTSMPRPGGGRQPQSLEARAAVEKCKAGDTTGIPVIEKALKDAKIDLPPRS